MASELARLNDARTPMHDEGKARADELRDDEVGRGEVEEADDERKFAERDADGLVPEHEVDDGHLREPEDRREQGPWELVARIVGGNGDDEFEEDDDRG